MIKCLKTEFQHESRQQISSYHYHQVPLLQLLFSSILFFYLICLLSSNPASCLPNNKLFHISSDEKTTNRRNFISDQEKMVKPSGGGELSAGNEGGDGGKEAALLGEEKGGFGSGGGGYKDFDESSNDNHVAEGGDGGGGGSTGMVYGLAIAVCLVLIVLVGVPLFGIIIHRRHQRNNSIRQRRRRPFYPLVFSLFRRNWEVLKDGDEEGEERGKGKLGKGESAVDEAAVVDNDDEEQQTQTHGKNTERLNSDLVGKGGEEFDTKKKETKHNSGVMPAAGAVDDNNKHNSNTKVVVPIRKKKPPSSSNPHHNHKHLNNIFNFNHFIRGRASDSVSSDNDSSQPPDTTTVQMTLPSKSAQLKCVRQYGRRKEIGPWVGGTGPFDIQPFTAEATANANKTRL